MRIVMKIGGALDGRGQLELAKVLRQVVDEGHQVLLVHGGGPEITRRLAERKIELPFVDGLRITTDEGIETVVEALQYCNDQLCEALSNAGLTIRPFTDGRQVVARDVGSARTGDVEQVLPDALVAAWEDGGVPLIPPYGRHPDGRMFNLNADTTASFVAQACKADKLIFCTNVSGVFTDAGLTNQLFDVTPSELVELLAGDAFTDGMIPKVRSMMAASDAGTPQVWVVDGCDGDSLAFAVNRDRNEYEAHRTVGGTCLVCSQVQSEVG